MRQYVVHEKKRIINLLKNEQTSIGTWEYPFETGISTDAYMIILLRSLEINDEELIDKLVRRILKKQEENGAWKLFYDEDKGSLSATIEAYYALLYSGYVQESDPALTKAKKQILHLGGIEKSHMFTKIMLSLTGQYKWPNFFPIPVEIMLLPESFPVHIYDFSVYGRANLIPLLILSDKKYRLKTTKSPSLQDLIIADTEDDFLNWHRNDEWRSIHSHILHQLKKIVGIPSKIHSIAVKKAEHYMLERIEPDGTFLNYFSSTFLMIFALLSLGYSKNDPIIEKAVNGLKSMTTPINGETHIQYTTATIWNTALISYALQEAGEIIDEPVVKNANNYLLTRQHVKFGDWAVNTPSQLPGGWGFSDVNTMNPDVDDTTAALRAIYRLAKKEPIYRQAWDRGVRWLVSMQNQDGGWGAFEKNDDKTFLHMMPIQGGEYLLTDPSTPDLTGRTLEFFGNYTNMKKNHSVMKHAVEWLLKHQRKDGSWYGRWGICYIYGTWAALTGLTASGLRADHPSIQKAKKWLLDTQNADGGWGESCKSDIQRTFVPLGKSTLTHTAWAVDALIACSDEPETAIEAGVKFLVENAKKDDWTTSYPKGQGMAGAFYMHYHSYDKIFPLLAFTHYQKKF